MRYKWGPFLVIVALLAFALSLASSFPLYAAPRVQSTASRSAVKVAPGCADALLVQALPIIPEWYEVHATPDTARALLAPCAQVVTPIYDLRAFDLPNDPALADQWHVGKIQAPQAWDKSRGDGAIVAVLDTGVDFDHPDLQNKLISRGKDFINTDDDATDDHGHGTHVAGIVAAATNNGIGVASVGRNAMVLPVKVLGAGGSGSTATVARGMDWASQQPGVKAINLSLGVVTGASDPLMADAVALVRARGVAVIAAAGNSGTAMFTSPAAEPGVIGVAATDRTDRRAYFSNYGINARIAAPGDGILSTVMGGGYQSWQGTSMAAPVASGVYALAAAACPACSLDQLEARLLAGDDIGEQQIGRRVNALYAVGSVQPPTATPDPASTPRPLLTPTPSPDYDTEVVTRINAYRRGQGREPLSIDARLVQIAREHNQAMLDCARARGWNDGTCFSHRVPGEPDVWERLQRAGYAPNAGSETIAHAYADPYAVVQGWAGSPPHNAIMLSDWTTIGCDYANPYSRWDSTVWTCDYGRREAQPTPRPPSPPQGWVMQVELSPEAGWSAWDRAFYTFCQGVSGVTCRWVRR